MAKVLGEPVKRWTDEYVGQSIRIAQAVGWDYVSSFTFFPIKGLKTSILESTDSEGEGQNRVWVDETAGPIGSWEDFERYKWPEDVKLRNKWNRNIVR